MEGRATKQLRVKEAAWASEVLAFLSQMMKTKSRVEGNMPRVRKTQKFGGMWGVEVMSRCLEPKLCVPRWMRRCGVKRCGAE